MYISFSNKIYLYLAWSGGGGEPPRTTASTHYKVLHPAPALPYNQGVPMFVLHHLNPPISGKRYPPISGKDRPTLGWLPLAFTKNHPPPPFPMLSRVIFQRLCPPYPLSREKWEHACGPLMHSSGGGGGTGVLHLSAFCLTKDVIKWLLLSRYIAPSRGSAKRHFTRVGNIYCI